MKKVILYGILKLLILIVATVVVVYFLIGNVAASEPNLHFDDRWNYEEEVCERDLWGQSNLI